MGDPKEIFLKQFMKMAELSFLGDHIRQSKKEYAQLQSDIAVFIKFVIEVYNIIDHSDEMGMLQDLFTQIIILAYHEAAKNDQDVADALINSFVKDYPEADESCLQRHALTMFLAATSFKEVAYSPNMTLIWQQLIKLVEAYNEFLNALLGFIIPCILCGKGVDPSTQVFNQSYNSKIEQLNKLTGGNDGPFYLIGRIARPKLRNAIAHSSIWFDSDSATVFYLEGSKKKLQQNMPLIELMALANIGSFLGEAFLVGVSAVAVFKDGTLHAKSLMPQHLLNVFNTGLLKLPDV